MINISLSFIFNLFNLKYYKIITNEINGYTIISGYFLSLNNNLALIND